MTDAYLDWAATLSGLCEKPVRDRFARLVAQGIVAPPPPRRASGGKAAQNVPHPGSRDAQRPRNVTVWEQIFVRASDPDMPPKEFFRRVPSDPERGLAYDPFEVAYAAGLQGGRRAPVDAVMYRRRLPEPAFRASDLPFDVIATGGLVSADAIARALPLPDKPFAPEQVALALIDDALPLLHERLTRGFTSTRFAALWTQVLLANQPGMPALGVIEGGAALDAVLGRLGAESFGEVYAERARLHYPYGTKHALSDPASHGSVMLDAAAGAPAQGTDPLHAVPLLGVQLPPQSFDDTSGRRLEIPMLQGIRWAIFTTFLFSLAKKLVINASIGIVAGPKNGRSFLEQQIAREIERANTFMGDDDAVNLTLPYGNAYEDRLVARQTLAPDAAMALPLRLLPDDRTPSYLEIRVPGGGEGMPPLGIGLQGPAPADVVPVAQIPPGSFVDLPGSPGPVGRIYHVAPRPLGGGIQSDGYFVVACAPTATTAAGDLLIRPGLWTVELRNDSGAPIDVVAQVQRDDSPFPRQTGARQAYLETENARGWNPRRRAFDAVTSAGPLTHEGTNSAYSTVPHANVTTAGGAIVSGHRALEPAEYTAQGADWSGSAPDGSALTETGYYSIGVRASGMGGAATARLAGTSTASATVARDLLLERLGAPTLPRSAIPPSDRLGEWVISGNPAFRR